MKKSSEIFLDEELSTQGELENATKIEKPFKSDNVSAFISLFECMLFGFIIQISTTLGNPLFINRAAVFMFTFPCLGNVVITLCKLECVITMVLVDFIYLVTTAAFYFAPVNMSSVICCFSLFGFATGALLNVVPIYMSQAATGKIMVFLLTSIGGCGIVLGLIIGKNICVFMGDDYLLLLITTLSALFGLYLFIFSRRVKIDGKVTMSNYKELFRNGWNSFILIVIAMSGVNLAGINYVVFNAPKIFENKGGSESVLYFNLCNFIAIAMTYLSVVFNIYVGRKIMFLSTAFLCFIINLLFMFTELKHHRWISFAFIIAFNAGISSVPYILGSEIFPLKTLQEGMMAGNVSYWIAGIFSMMTFGEDNTVGFMISEVYLLIGISYFLLMYKETRNQAEANYQPNKVTVSFC